jgi:hypothetical protein
VGTNGGYELKGYIMNIQKIKQAAKQATDENGNPVIQIPLSI